MPAIKPANSEILNKINEDKELVPHRLDIMIDSIHRMAHCGDNEYWLRLQDVFLDFLSEQVYSDGEAISINGEPHFGYEILPDEDFDLDGLFDENQKHFCMYFRV
jgi:hypothetical protein